jgi:uncharacterized protein YaaQ
MKLVVAVIQAEDASGATSQLVKRGFCSTHVKTVGGFLREANATIIVGVEDDDVEAVLHTIGDACTGANGSPRLPARASDCRGRTPSRWVGRPWWS